MSISRRDFLMGAAALVSVAPSAARADASISHRVDDYLTRLSGYGYSGATLLVKDGAILLRKGYGSANDADAIHVRPDTIFDIGSQSKTFTAGAMMRLVARQQIQLEDPISKFLNGVPADKRAITIEQLLSHTAGLASEMPLIHPTGPYYEEISRDEAIARVFATPLIDAPGVNFHYSNQSYILAAAIIETVAERPFRDFVRSEILMPLNLTSTGFWGTGLPRVPETRLARSYGETDDTVETANLRRRSGDTWVDLGSGEMVSTVDDLYSWMHAMRGSSFLPVALRDRMWTPVKAEYGLGWYIERHGPGGRRIHHGGDIDGFCAELAYYPDSDLVLANLGNRRKGDVLSTRYAADRVIPLIVQGQPPRIFPFPTFDTFDFPPRWVSGHARLDATVGRYVLDSGGELSVAKGRDDRHRLAARGQDAIDAIFPSRGDERSLRARSSTRAVALMHAVVAGDRTALTDTLRHGAPIEDYQQDLARSTVNAQLGSLISIEAIGTAPWDFPVNSLLTSLKLRFERGETYLRFGWDRTQDRIIYTGLDGPQTFGWIPLRENSEFGIVGWNIITGRSVRINASGQPARTIQVETSDGARTTAVRVG